MTVLAKRFLDEKEGQGGDGRERHIAGEDPGKSERPYCCGHRSASHVRRPKMECREQKRCHHDHECSEAVEGARSDLIDLRVQSGNIRFQRRFQPFHIGLGCRATLDETGDGRCHAFRTFTWDARFLDGVRQGQTVAHGSAHRRVPGTEWHDGDWRRRRRDRMLILVSRIVGRHRPRWRDRLDGDAVLALHLGIGRLHLRLLHGRVELRGSTMRSRNGNRCSSARSEAQCAGEIWYDPESQKSLHTGFAVRAAARARNTAQPASLLARIANECQRHRRMCEMHDAMEIWS